MSPERDLECAPARRARGAAIVVRIGNRQVEPTEAVDRRVSRFVGNTVQSVVEEGIGALKVARS